MTGPRFKTGTIVRASVQDLLKRRQRVKTTMRGRFWPSLSYPSSENPNQDLLFVNNNYGTAASIIN
jgi:hypothetical protein